MLGKSISWTEIYNNLLVCSRYFKSAINTILCHRLLLYKHFSSLSNGSSKTIFQLLAQNIDNEIMESIDFNCRTGVEN